MPVPANEPTVAQTDVARSARLLHTSGRAGLQVDTNVSVAAGVTVAWGTAEPPARTVVRSTEVISPHPLRQAVLVADRSA